MIRSLPIAALLAFTLSACTSTGGSGPYPSLDRRPAERADGRLPVCPTDKAGRVTGTAEPVVAEPAPPPPAAGPDAALVTRLAQLLEDAHAADQAFSARRARAERLVSAAGGAAVASESWSVANVGLADLQAASNAARIALAELDRLYTAERIDHFEESTPSAEAIADARERVLTIVSGQDGVLLALRRRLGV